MLFLPLLFKPFLWVIPVTLQMMAYYFLFKKMGLSIKYAVLPFVAEWRLAKVLFRYRRSFWRPCIVACVLGVFAAYLNPFEGTSVVIARIYLIIASVVYEFFLLRLYWRLSGTFYNSILARLVVTLVTWLLPPLGLGIITFGKASYKGSPAFKKGRSHGPVVRYIRRAVYVTLSAAEVAAFVVGVGFFTLRAHPPRILAQSILDGVIEDTKDVTGTGDVITREASMGDAYERLDSMPVSRDKFFPDHSQDKSVVVMTYIIGADLEDTLGYASANIAQMIEATKQGSGLSFVLQCGGSGRWFTKGIEDNTYGRYLVHDGTLEKVADLDETTCMSEQQSLADFINWCRDTYPADRNMLVMWDHGGGLSAGYGKDVLNKREVGYDDMPTLAVSEIRDAIDQSGVRFDVIGFDACLMQDIDIAAALEPYADYYLASEEVEGGYGWFYTSAFGKLAANPGMSSEEFGHEMIACYDPYNTIIKGDEGQPNTEATLSFVDLPRARAAFEQMDGLFDDAHKALLEESASYADLSLSGTKSYQFQNYEQVDLIDFLTCLRTLDYERKICSREEMDDLINAVRACVIYRNANSAEGVNGMALSFPCESISSYGSVYKQLTTFSFGAQEDLYTDFFSIMAAQKKKEADAAVEAGETSEFMATFEDYTDEDWYVSGFEDYETQESLIDIPLTEVEDGYRIELPEAAWDIIADSQIIAYQRTGDGKLRYLGVDSIGATDEEGHPIVAMGNTWVHIGGRLVCYESEDAYETKAGVIYTGKVKARLNGRDDVILNIKWNVASEDSDEPAKGYVDSYDIASYLTFDELLTNLLGEDATSAFNAKAHRRLQPGDRLEFLFDYYDEEGNLAETDIYGSPVTVIKETRLTVTDEPMDECDLVFGGVLTDVYQRTMTTEKIEAHVTE